MTSRIKTLIITAAIGLLGAGAAQCADAMAVKASIPFDFVAANRHLPAGDYWFLSQTPGVIHVLSGDMKRTLATTACMPARAENADPGQLMFRRYGSQHFLKSITSGVLGFGATLPKSRAEKEWSRTRVTAMVPVSLN